MCVCVCVCVCERNGMRYGTCAILRRWPRDQTMNAFIGRFILSSLRCTHTTHVHELHVNNELLLLIYYTVL